MRIEIVVFDGFDEMDALGPFEVFDSAARAGADFDVALVGVDRPGRVTASHGVVLEVSRPIGSPDAIVIPGGGWLEDTETGVRKQVADGVLPAAVAELASTVQWTASVCTGGMLLAEAGILTGRTATTNRGAHEQLRGYGVTVRPERVVDDGNVVTAGGITCGIDLALHLTERGAGADIAATVGGWIEYPRDRAAVYIAG